ncbi:AMP-binding protein [Nocardioides limicola]|uniref:AMP-binding protein n=1 Tax=Nocardioides limicola TaxID=2803368 RepID=UPI0027DCE1AA|nr:AMP-binding protein [Nocardioides sp. DJM-14]
MEPLQLRSPDVAALSDWLAAEDDRPLLVETSGSTGAPKRVLLSRDAVKASAQASARRLGATGPWLLALPVSYVAGVQVLVRSLLAGHRPTLLDEHPSVAAAVAAMPAGDRFVSLVPTQLGRLLDDPDEAAALATCHTVLLGGGPIDPALRERAAAAGIRVVATYGAAETAGGCVYDGLPLDGVGVALGDDGRIRIAGPILFHGYDGDPGSTAAHLVDGWYLTADAGRFDLDGRLQVLGRLDDMLISGGVKVPAPVVARLLRGHPSITDVEVVGVADGEWGQRVVALVVPAGTPPTLAQIRDFVADEHPRSWAPRELVVLDRLPLLGNGKVDRQALLALASAAR